MALTKGLLIVLNTTGLQQKDNRLYQVIQDLIKNLADAEDIIATLSTSSTSSSTGITQLTGDVLAGPGSGSVVSTLSTTGITAGTYGTTSAFPSFIVDTKGRLTFATEIPFTGSSGITQLTGDVLAGPGSGSVVSTLSTTGIIAGTYGSSTAIPIITFDAKGRATTATTVSFTGGTGITQLTGDVLAGPGSGSVVSTLSTTGVVAGTYGDANNVGQFQVDDKGRLVSATNVAIVGGSGSSVLKVTTVVTTSGITSVSFTGYSTYSELEIKFSARSNRAAVNAEDVFIRFNADTTSGYDTELIYNATSATAAAFQILAGTHGLISIIPGTTAPAGRAGGGSIKVYDYKSTTFNKVASAENHANVAATNSGILTRVWGVTWRNTNAVTTVTIGLTAGELTIGSSFTAIYI